MSRNISVTMPSRDWGQIEDCLRLRMDQYRKTAAYFETGEAGDSIIQEVNGAEEATNMVHIYSSLLENIIGELEQSSAAS